MTIAKQGVGYLLMLSAAGVVCLAFAATRPFSILFLALAAFVAFFFRDPTRAVPTGDGLLVAPGDGKVVYAGPSDEQDTSELKVAIFLSLFDVHINRIPMNGRVETITYRPGKFLAAYNPDASSKNEQNELVLSDGNYTIRLRQIVGVVARRIVCDVRPEAMLERGQRYGLMQFGSRMEILMPSGTTLEVAVGDRVRGGETVIARRVDSSAATDGMH